MSSYAYRIAVKKEQFKRPTSVALVSVAGVIAGLAIAALVIIGTVLRMQLGASMLMQLLDLSLGLFIPLLLIWLYWGVWEVLPSAWWSHIMLGPFLVIGMLVIVSSAADITPFLAHDLPKPVIEFTINVVRITALVVAGIELATIVCLLNARSLFKIGEKKPVWERVNR